jgi:hypothetical protein
MERSQAFASLRSLVPGIVVYCLGGLLWLGSAGFLFFVAIPILLLGAFLLVFSFLVTKHSSPLARAVSACFAVLSIASCVALVWP